MEALCADNILQYGNTRLENLMNFGGDNNVKDFSRAVPEGDIKSSLVTANEHSPPCLRGINALHCLLLSVTGTQTAANSN